MNGRPASALLPPLIGPLIWAAHFLAMYVIEAVLCTPHVGAPYLWIRTAGGALSVAALAALTAHYVISRLAAVAGDEETTTAFVLPLTLLSAIATLWTTLPLFLLPVCTSVGL